MSANTLGGLRDLTNPHASGRLLHAGSDLEQASGLVILLHGRGGSAEDILSLREVFDLGEGGRDLAWFAPEAANRSWYPQSFLAAPEENEPYLTSALLRIESLIATAAKAGIGCDRIVIGGFSQGACLTTQFAASHPARYAGLLAFTGGLVGPPGTAFTFAGDLERTPALLMSSDPDAFVPWTRVQETAEVLQKMGADVTLRCYPGRPHIVSQDEIRLAKSLLVRAFSAASTSE